MKIRNKIIAIVAGITLAFTGSMGSYAYFRAHAKDNGTLSTKKFPKARVKIYASVGPLYSGAFMIPKEPNGKSECEIQGGVPNKATPNYERWLNNACKYIVNDMERKPSLGILDKDEISQYDNIPNNNGEEKNAEGQVVGKKVPIVDDVGTVNCGSWAGKIIDSTVNQNRDEWEGKIEQGTMIHYVVAISNAAPYGGGENKLDYRSRDIVVNQYDTYSGKGNLFPVNQTLNAKDSQITLTGKENRLRTYNWNGSNYEACFSDGNNSKPSQSCDLIVFDVGSKGYYITGKDQYNLTSLIRMISGCDPQWQIDPDTLQCAPCWSKCSPMYNAAIEMFNHKPRIQKAGLIYTTCGVSFKYDNDDVPATDKYKVNVEATTCDPSQNLIVIPDMSVFNNIPFSTWGQDTDKNNNNKKVNNEENKSIENKQVINNDTSLKEKNVIKDKQIEEKDKKQNNKVNDIKDSVVNNNKETNEKNINESHDNQGTLTKDKEVEKK